MQIRYLFRYSQIIFAAVALSSLSTVTAFAEAQEKGTALTVYSSADPGAFDPQQFIAQQNQGYEANTASQVPGFGVVKETREVTLPAGISELKITDVAQFIDPTTVSFADLTDPKTVVHDQTFQFDLANSEKILRRYIDKQVTIVAPKGNTTEEISGVLISTAGTHLVVQTPNGIQLVTRGGPQIKLGELPGGLITKPTLVLKVASQLAGKHSVRTTYQTSGLTWRADYNVLLNEKENAAEIGAWVTLLNVSGAAYPDSALKLIAGDVQRIQPGRQKAGRLSNMMEDAVQSAAPGFQEKSFFEYHLYSLPRRIDVLSQATQQITLFPTAHAVPVEKVLVYYGAPDLAYWGYGDTANIDRQLGSQSNPKLDVYLRFKNDEAHRMGMPLPKGKVRVYKQDDADNSLEFIGEDLVDHTARDETVLIKLGQSFDVVGERVQTDFSVDSAGRKMSETYRITLRNHKAEAAKVIVKENLFRWTNWEIVAKSDPFEKVDARTVHFTVDVPARGEKVLSYTAKYTW